MQLTSQIHIIEGVVAPASGWKYFTPAVRRTSTKFFTSRYHGYNPALIVDKGVLTLIDAGPPESLPRFKEYIEGLGFHLKDIKNIFITHAHADHVGGLKRLVDASGARVLAHINEAPYVEKKILGSRDFEAAKVDVTLKDGDNFDILGGLKIIFTPGHTPGHISLYSAREKCFFAGGLVRYLHGDFHMTPAQLSSDYAALLNSMVKACQYDFDILLPYQGEPLIGGAGAKFRELVEYLKAISDILLPHLKEALAPEIE